MIQKLNMGFKNILLFCTSMLLASVLTAQVKYSNEFLHLGVGARSLGMGNSTVANNNDVTAGYWNPAGLLNLENNLELGFMHNEYFAGIAAYDYVGIGFKLDDKSAAGVTFLRFGVDDIPDTRNLVDANGNIDYDRIESFSSVDNALLISYARKMPIEGLNVGGNVKIVYRKVGVFANAVGFGIDVSGTYTRERLKLGAVLRDGTGTWNAWRFNTAELEEVFTLTNNEIPNNSLEISTPQLILGGGYEIDINERFGIYPEINLATTFDGKRNVVVKTSFASIDPRVGFELNYKKMFFLRAGIGGFQQESSIDGDEFWSAMPNMGIGVKLKKVAFDYALTNIGDDAALYSNVISLRIGINKRK